MENSLSIQKLRSLVLMAIILLGALVTFIGTGTLPAHAATDLIVCPTDGTLKGVDVSKFQNTIDWTQVANAGISFGYAKATEGTTFIDPTFQTNFAAMKAAGVKRGAYLFFHPGQDPTAQANLFLSTLMQAGFTSGDLIPAIDVEESDGQSPATIVSHLQTTVRTIQSAIGVSLVIFTAPGFWNSLGDPTAFAGNPLWIANIGASCPNIPAAPWTTWTLWQYSFTGHVSGITNPVDLDQSNGTTLPIYTTAEQISALINLVNSFPLSKGLQTSLNAKLNAALNAVNAGNTSAACGQIGAFINQVNAQSGNRLTMDQAMQLRKTAQLIQAALAC